jgi:lysyl-tRNA synthetase class 2
MGKATFIDIQDSTASIQIYYNIKTITKRLLKNLNKLIPGTIIWCRGVLFRTKSEVLSVKLYYYSILVYPETPLPDLWYGIKDIHKRYTYRYLDLFLNSTARNIILKRIVLIQHIRCFLIKRKYCEVETPTLHNIAGGAVAKPFITYSNIFKKNFYLRIAPELFLKRLMIAGFEKIFEIGKNFRNEGVSYKHNFEFTSIELYEAYATYKDYIILVEKLIKSIVYKLHKRKNNIKHKEHFLNFNNSFSKFTYIKALIKYTSHFFNSKTIRSKNLLIEYIQKNNLQIPHTSSIDEIHNIIFEKIVVPRIIQPTFIIESPACYAPLARKYKNSNNVERFELYIAGIEIADGFSELNDVTTQENNFRKQTENSEDQQSFDLTYIQAMKYGLPPTTGVGIGIDRLTMILLDCSTINETLFFPAI